MDALRTATDLIWNLSKNGQKQGFLNGILLASFTFGHVRPRTVQTPMKITYTLTAVGIAALMTTGCIGYERESTLGPTSTGVAALLGSWTSGNLVPQPGQCTDFKWDVTEQTGNSARGTFSATCAGDLRLNGSAEATLAGSLVTWTAQATANVAGLANCSITLSGSAELQSDSVRIPYSGNTFLGPVSGVETLRRR